LDHSFFKLTVVLLKTDNALMHFLVVIYKLMERTFIFVNNRSKPLIFSPKSQNIFTKLSYFFLVDCILFTSGSLNLFLEDSSLLVVKRVLHLCVIDQLFDIPSGFSFFILIISQIDGQLLVGQIELPS
jgi:hypothetical protein